MTNKTYTSDIVVCGAGTAGAVAAIAAADQGKDVILIEQYGIPGGSATTCYCRMLINDSQYITQQIAISGNGEGISFDLTCDVDTKVTILRRWGEAKEDSSRARSIFHLWRPM